MSALANRPEDNNEDDSNKDEVIPSFTTNSNMGDLSIEKQFTHHMFLNQISNVDIDTAKQLLADLHLLYLANQDFLVK